MRLEAKNVSFRYGRRGPWVLEDVSLAVESGRRLALLAPSGFGKTTLALLLAGYLSPVRGRFCWTGGPCRKRASARCSSSASTRRRPSTPAGG